MARGSGRNILAAMSVGAMEREIARRQKVAAGLVRERRRLEARLAAIDAKLAAAGALVHGAGSRRVAGRGRRVRPRNAMNLVQSLTKLLKGRTLSVKEMVVAVQRAGYKTTSPNFRTIVNQTLIRFPKLFKKVSRGKYTVE